ncbi:MAG TPA: DUF3667 domain-containing protein [Sunxiuqinia sp.]|nr:DUF3667 domain-containing protein [Sunxiuqinia sp.]
MAKWRKNRKVPFDELREHECPNCGHEFKGYYCPNCGQSNTEFDRPVGFVFYDFLGNLFAFDSRFVHTFRDLLFRPGFLTTEFFQGRRVRYAPPFRLYIFVSFILFLLLQVMSNKALEQSFKRLQQADEGAALADSISQGNGDSVNVDLGAIPGQEADSAQLSIKLEDYLKAKNIRESMLVAAHQVDQKLKTAKDPSERKKLMELSGMLRSPQQLISRMLKYLSWAFFVLLPVFALLLKLFYVRRKIYYIRHLIFSIHIHSFLFVILTLVVLLNLIFHGSIGVLSLWLLVIAPIYIYLAMHNFYRQGYLKTFFKFILLGAIYNLVVVLTVVYVFVQALNVI